MHGQGKYYPQRIYKVNMLLKAAREMLVGLAHNLLYPMILRCNWKEIYEVLHIAKDRGLSGLMGDEEEIQMVESFDVEGLSNEPFRDAQAE